MSDVLIFGLALLVVLLLVFFVLAYRFPSVVEAFFGGITQVDLNMTGLKIRLATTAAQDAQKGKPLPPAGTPPAAETVRLLISPPRLLWVDDHAENNQNELAVFRAIGMQLETARSNSEAIKAAHAARPDLVISDIDRDSEGPGAGLRLPDDLREAGIEVEIVYYVGEATGPQTATGAPVTDNPAELLARVAERLLPETRRNRVRTVVP